MKITLMIEAVYPDPLASITIATQQQASQTIATCMDEPQIAICPARLPLMALDGLGDLSLLGSRCIALRGFVLHCVEVGGGTATGQFAL